MDFSTPVRGTKPSVALPDASPDKERRSTMRSCARRLVVGLKRIPTPLLFQVLTAVLTASPLTGAVAW